LLHEICSFERFESFAAFERFDIKLSKIRRLSCDFSLVFHDYHYQVLLQQARVMQDIA